MLQANALFIAWAPRPELLQGYADDADVVRAALICAYIACPCSVSSAAYQRRITCQLGFRWQDRSAMSRTSTCLFPIPSTSSYLVLSPVVSPFSAHVCSAITDSTGERKRDFERYRMRRTGAALHLLRTISKRTRSCPRDGSAPLSRGWTAFL